MTVVRAELRPADTIPDGIISVGAHWSWSEHGAQVMYHDNAYDEHGKEGLEEVILVAEVPFTSIDWPFTIATNLILPGEAEITIKPGSVVTLQEIFRGKSEFFDAKGRRVEVSGSCLQEA